MIANFLSDPVSVILTLASVIAALSIHEFAHAWVAWKLGDTTAESEGRLTLNPLAHIDPWGFLFLVLAGFGWGKPVMVDNRNFRWKKWGTAAVSFAGPLSNFLFAAAIMGTLVILSTAGLSIIQSSQNLGIEFIFRLALINVMLGAFNLLPIPPLDGSKVFYAIANIPIEWQEKAEQYGPLLLLAIILIDIIFRVGILSPYLTAMVRGFFSLFGV